MDPTEALKSILRSEARGRFYVQIEPNRVLPATPSQTFDADQHYLRIWLNQVFLAHKRVLYKTRVPLAHAYCRLLYGGQSLELPLVAGPGQLAGLSRALDGVVDVNYCLLGPIPFRGGEVELILALVPVTVADYGERLLDLLGSLSQLSGRGEMALALRLVQTLKRGVEGLFDFGEMRPHLGVHDTFAASQHSPNRLSSGYRVLINIDPREAAPPPLWVLNGRLMAGSTPGYAKPFGGADYLLFSIECLDRRDDMLALPNIRAAWDETVTRARGASEAELDLSFNKFRGLVLTSPDLIWADQIILIKTLAERVGEIRELPSGFGITQREPDVSIQSTLTAPRPSHLARHEVLGISWRTEEH